MFKLRKQTWILIGILVPLVTLFAVTMRNAGPLAPVNVVLQTVAEAEIQPALFGVGTVEAQYSHKIGPTFASRIKQLDVEVGDRVTAGQFLGEMDPIDLDQRLEVHQAAIRSAQANFKQAQAKQEFALSQAQRYQKLLPSKAVSEEAAAAKQQELHVANAALKFAKQETLRVEAEYQAALAQRNSLKLISPINGLVTSRLADPGTTLVAGQTVIEIINPEHLWVNTRFDQISAEGLAANLDASIQLRSRSSTSLAAKVLRVEPLADAITEEMLAKVIFNTTPAQLPPLGELAEVTVDLAKLPAAPVISNAAIVRYKNQLGVWKYTPEGIEFVAVSQGKADLNGLIQITSGIQANEQVILYSDKPLHSKSRINIKESLL